MLILPIPGAATQAEVVVAFTAGTDSASFNVPDGRWQLVAASLTDEASPIEQLAAMDASVVAQGNKLVGPVNARDMMLQVGEWSPVVSIELTGGTTYTLQVSGRQTTQAYRIALLLRAIERPCN